MLTKGSNQQQQNIKVRYLPHVDIKAGLKLGENVDGVVDIVVKVRPGVESVRTGLQQQVGQELQQLLRGYCLGNVIIRMVLLRPREACWYQVSGVVW